MPGADYKDLGLMWLTDALTVIKAEVDALEIALLSLDNPSSWFGVQIARVIKVKTQYIEILEKEIALG